jgi:hypothetical protein
MFFWVIIRLIEKNPYLCVLLHSLDRNKETDYEKDIFVVKYIIVVMYGDKLYKRKGHGWRHAACSSSSSAAI